MLHLALEAETSRHHAPKANAQPKAIRRSVLLAPMPSRHPTAESCTISGAKMINVPRSHAEMSPRLEAVMMFLHPLAGMSRLGAATSPQHNESTPWPPGSVSFRRFKVETSPVAGATTSPHPTAVETSSVPRAALFPPPKAKMSLATRAVSSRFPEIK